MYEVPPKAAPTLNLFVLDSADEKSGVCNGPNQSLFQIFIGSGGDRISANDFLLLFENGKATNSDAVLKKIQRLKDKGVHVMVIGIGKTDVATRDYYEELASLPNDAHDFGTVEVKHIIGDLAATTCVSVLCNTEDEKSKKKD